MARGGRLKPAELLTLREIAKRHADGAGLYFVVQSPGSASWQLRYMTAGVQRVVGLGPYPAVSLARAREKALAAKALKADGIDPLAEKRRLKQASFLEAQKAKTFRESAEDFYEARHRTWKSDVYRANWLQQMNSYAYPVIGEILIADIGRPEVLAVLNQKTGRPGKRETLWIAKRETARRVRNRIERILDAAAALELRSTENPAKLSMLQPLLPQGGSTRGHHGALDYEKAPAFFAQVRQAEGTTARALEFTILCAVRTSETLGAKWSEIDLDAALWTIPAERMKAGVLYRCPLSKTAIRVLKKVAEAHPCKRADYVFPGQRPGAPLSNMSMLKLVKRLGGPGITTHGFRATFRGWASNRTRYGVEIMEGALSHATKGAHKGAYMRSDLLEPRTVLMRRWAAYLLTELRQQREAKRRAALKGIGVVIRARKAKVAKPGDGLLSNSVRVSVSRT